MKLFETAPTKNAAIAQPVERILGKDEVASSNLASSSKEPEIYGFWALFLIGSLWSTKQKWQTLMCLPFLLIMFFWDIFYFKNRSKPK